jgi:hypothetical protein
MLTSSGLGHSVGDPDLHVFGPPGSGPLARGKDLNPDLLVGGTDPHQNVRIPQHCSE